MALCGQVSGADLAAADGFSNHQTMLRTVFRLNGGGLKEEVEEFVEHSLYFS